MTTKSINDQVRTIKSATQKASSSKEAAIAFLSKAGIINANAVAQQKPGRSALQEPTLGYAKSTIKHSEPRKSSKK